MATASARRHSAPPARLATLPADEIPFLHPETDFYDEQANQISKTIDEEIKVSLRARLKYDLYTV